MARAKPARVARGRARTRVRVRTTVKKRVVKQRGVKKRTRPQLRGACRRAEAAAGAAPRTPASSPPLAERAGGGEKEQTRWRKFDWDDELTEDVRRRYEETDESINSIAAAVEMSATQLRRKIEAFGWRRAAPVKRGLSPAAKLARRAAALLQAPVEAGPPVLTRADLRPIAETLLRTAQAHAAELDAKQKQKSAAGQTARDTHSLTGSLAAMTTMLATLAQLCAPEPERTSTDGDIDQQRNELARRIDALVDEWLHAAAADGASGHRGEAEA